MSKVATVYKTTNTLNGRYYIGVHVTDDPNDGYLGSGKLIIQAIKKYGKDSFVKEVLYVFDNVDEALNKESELITEELIESRRCYNITDGGGNPPTFIGDNHPNVKFKYKDRVDIANLYNSGKTLSEIANEYNTSKTAISYVLDCVNVDRRDANSYQKPSHINHWNWIEKDEERICNLYNSGKTTYEIASEFNLSDITIGNVLKRNGIKARSLSDYVSKSVIQISKCGNIINEYNSLKSASQETGVCKNAISRTARNMQDLAGGYEWKFKKEVTL